MCMSEWASQNKGLPLNSVSVDNSSSRLVVGGGVLTFSHPQWRRRRRLFIYFSYSTTFPSIHSINTGMMMMMTTSRFSLSFYHITRRGETVPE